MPSVHYQVNVEEVEKLANYLDTAGEDILERFQEEMVDVAHIILGEVFIRSWAGLDERQFPGVYRSHILDVVDNLPIEFIGDGYHTAGIAIDFDEIGTRDELEAAYHRHAKLAGGGEVEGAYDGEELKNATADRHVFFEALINGTDYVDPKTGKKIPARKLQGKWDETLDEYLEIWGDKSPEWLFLQHGTRWSPSIPPYDIEGEINRLINLRGDQLWAAEWARVLGSEEIQGNAGLAEETKNYYVEEHVYVDPTGGYHAPPGGITVGGKPYKRGQFIPKHG